MKDEKSLSDLGDVSIKKQLPEEEKELVKQIVVHEAYSAMYKLKLAQIVVFKGAKLAGKVLQTGGRIIKTEYVKHKQGKTLKK